MSDSDRVSHWDPYNYLCSFDFCYNATFLSGGGGGHFATLLPPPILDWPLTTGTSDADPDLYNKSWIQIRMERYESGSRAYTVNVQKHAMAKT